MRAAEARVVLGRRCCGHRGLPCTNPRRLALAFAAVGALTAALPLTGPAAQQQRASLHIKSAILVEPATTAPLAIEVGPQGSLPRNHFVRIRGLPAAAVLSEGHAISPGSWAVPLASLPALKITVPSVSQGQFGVTVSLLTIDGTVVDDAKTMLIVGATAPAAVTQGVADTPPRAAVASLGPSSASPPAATALKQQEALKLHASGLQRLGRGNIAAARMFFLRAAEAGLPQSALALGGTYDPGELARLKVIGLRPDRDAARKWYEKARELGSIEAVGRLQRLGTR